MLDLEYLNSAYFAFDKPVPYTVTGKTLYITPVPLVKADLFLRCVGLLRIDKDSSPSADIIKMSYLEFLLKVLLMSEGGQKFTAQLSTLFDICLGLKDWMVGLDEKGKVLITNRTADYKISAKQFDEIARIIMYQNIPHYDDSYIDPDLKKAMDDVDALKARNVDIPNIERKMAIITAHCGLPKREQIEMSLRSHQLLFEEVCGELDFITIRPIALFGGKGSELEHWIYKKKKGKFDDYISSIEDYNKSMGGNGTVQTI